jgi:hypothetical protein
MSYLSAGLHIQLKWANFEHLGANYGYTYDTTLDLGQTYTACST